MEQVDHTRGSYYPTPGGLTDILGQWEMSTWSSCVLQIFSTPLNPSYSSASISSLSKTWSVPPSLSSEGHLISHISHNSRQEKGSGPLHFHHLLTLRLMERTLLLWDFTPSQTSLCPDLCHLPTFGHSQSCCIFQGGIFCDPLPATGPYLDHKIANNKS